MCGAEAADTRSGVPFDDVEKLVESVSEFTYVFESTFVLGAEYSAESTARQDRRSFASLPNRKAN